MIIKVTEKCLTTDNEGKKCYGNRYYKYEVKVNNLLEAFKELEEKFDSDNIIESYDEFENECLDSEVIAIEIADEYY